jgi:hypothetical protein
MMVWLNAWPMCSVPVTLGGGSWMAKFRPAAAASALGAGAAETRDAVAALLPFRAPVRFQRGGLERFGQGLQAGLLEGVAHGVAQ